jgi:RNA polymerase sigma-70 factor (ECF subfamily)
VSANDDLADVDAVLGGDVDAFARIVHRWQGPLINLAYRFCRDRSRAEDLAQEVFLRAFRNLGSWRRDAAFSTWLFALATNLYRTEIRRIPPRLMPIGESVQIADSRVSYGNEGHDEAIRSAVSALPEKYREAVTLFYFHEMDVAAAAQSLGLPAGTVKARLSRGRALLRDKLSRFLSRSKTIEETR